MKTSELTGPALDWAVAKCENRTVLPKQRGGVYCTYQKGNLILLAYSTDWAQGGPIIERERFTLTHQIIDGNVRWAAQTDDDLFAYGPTPLISAMRCYVASRLGDEVEIPEELRLKP